jgi:succinate dehydrogenase flavin-adding protein (antitoxin of CptAB toxin-antitoxin module)
MLYPLYEYYKNSDLNLDEIVDHYVSRFYSKKHDGKKVLKVLSKVRESSKIKNLCGQSATRRIAPNHIDFASVINEILWFAFKSNMTQALGVLFAIMYWDEKINKVYSLKDEIDVRDDAIKIFKKFSVFGDMTPEEYSKSEHTNDNHKEILGKEAKMRISVNSSDNNTNEDETESEEFWSIHTVGNLSAEERYTLFWGVSHIGGLWGLSADSNRKKASKKIVKEYQEILEISDEKAYTISYNSGLSYYDFYEKLQLIHYVPEINRFVFYCVSVIDLSYDRNAIRIFSEILGIIRYTNEDLIKLFERVDHQKQKHFFYKQKLECIPPVIPYKTDKKWSVNTVSTLSFDDRNTLFYFVNHLSYLYDKKRCKRRKKYAIETVRRYQKILGISDEQLHAITNKKGKCLDSYLERLNTINNHSEINRFLYCCVSICDLSYDKNTLDLFNLILERIGYSKEDLHKLFLRFDYAPKWHFYDDNVKEYQQARSTEVYSQNKKLSDENRDNPLSDQKSNDDNNDELCTDATEEELSNAWIDDNGVKYSADKKKLLYAHEYIKYYAIKEGTEILCDGAFSNIDFEDVDNDYLVKEGLSMYDFAIFVSELTSIYIPSSVRRIGKGVFDYCNKLTCIYVPIGEKSRFEGLLPDYKDILVEGEIPTTIINELANIKIDEDGVKYNKDKNLLLKAPPRIIKYSIAEGTKIIGNAAFSNCEQLKSVILPDSITEIGHYAFANCKSIFAFALPNSIKRIGNGVFMGCSELSSIRIPELETIENDMFQGCEKLNSVFVPIGEKYKYENLLWEHNVAIHEYDPNKLDDVETLDKILHGLVDEYGVLYDFEGKTLMSASRDLTTYSIIPGTTGIKAEAFNPVLLNLDGTSLKKLYLPDSIQFIGEGAFANNTGLEYINIPKYAILFHFGNPFAGCINLHNIKWETVFYIKEGTLIYDKNRTVLIACLGWQYVDGIQNSWPLLAFAKAHGKMKTGHFSEVDAETGEVRNFKSAVFVDPADGKTVKCFVGFSSQLGEITDEEIIARKNDLIIVQTCSDSYRLCQTGTDRIYPDKIVELPEGLESIVANAFYGNEYLEEISLPKSLKEIGKDAFKGCSNLKKIHVPQGTISKFKELLPEWRAIIYEDQDDDLPF